MRNREQVLESRRRTNMLCKYGISLADKERLFVEQDGKCANPNCVYIFKDINDAMTDHNHATEKVRGLLCRACNSGIGCFKDNVEMLRGAIEYLIKAEGL